MTPFFNPGPHRFPNIPIYIAGVNPRMCQLAGELCQGLHVHPLHTQKYLQAVIWPNVQVGLAKSNRQRADIQLCSTIFVIPTNNSQEAAKIKAEVQRQVAFYASTPVYRPIFETHGWGEIAGQLSQLASHKRWSEMPSFITDEMLEAFAVTGRWEELPQKIQQKYSGELLDRVSYYVPFEPNQNETGWRATVAGFKAG